MKSIYIETTIPSYITAKDSKDMVKFAHQLIARKFWNTERQHYQLYISKYVIDECSRGDIHAAKKRIELIKSIASLPETREVAELANIYKDLLHIPDYAETDAFHLSITVINKVDYLLTYNFRHMGPETLQILSKYNNKNGYTTPILSSPEILTPPNREEGYVYV